MVYMFAVPSASFWTHRFCCWMIKPLQIWSNCQCFIWPYQHFFSLKLQKHAVSFLWMVQHFLCGILCIIIWTASSEFGTYSLCEQRRFRRACASAQSRQNLRCSLIQAVSQEEPSDRKPDPWPLWMAGHAQLKFVMTECSKTQIRLTRLIYHDQKALSVKFPIKPFMS